MDFNNVKFFDLKFMVKKLNDKGFWVIVWLYLFFNIDLNVFIEVVLKFYLIKEFDFVWFGLILWWDGKLVGIFDVINFEVIEWYLNKIKFF